VYPYGSTAQKPYPDNPWTAPPHRPIPLALYASGAAAADPLILARPSGRRYCSHPGHSELFAAARRPRDIYGAVERLLVASWLAAGAHHRGAAPCWRENDCGTDSRLCGSTCSGRRQSLEGS